MAPEAREKAEGMEGETGDVMRKSHPEVAEEILKTSVPESPRHMAACMMQRTIPSVESKGSDGSICKPPSMLLS